MFHWFGYIGLNFGLNPSTRLLWGETSWAMSSAMLLYIGRSGMPWC